jgi:tetratricopeptide (TPR) repeat protein
MHIYKYKLQFIFFTALLFVLLTHVKVATAVSLSEIQQIAKTGAVDLSERILEREQPQLKSKPEQWMSWEKQRISFYQLRKHWQQIVDRLQTLPDFVDADFIFWAKTQRAVALINLHEGEQARYELRGLIWRLNADKRAGDLVTHWRRLIIKSYLTDGLAADASMASIRLQQDLVEPDPQSAYEDTLVRARIAILNNQAKEAIQLLKPLSDKADAATLMLLAQLRGQTRSPKHVMQAAYRYLGDKQIDKEFKVNLWAVISEAAQRMGRRGTRANALEHILANRENLTLDESIFNVNSDSLWNAYIDYAVQISNKEQLLIGQDKEWLDVSERISKEKPVGARAMSVFVMLRSSSDKYREQAASMFTRMLKKRRSASKLLTELFLNSKQYPVTKAIPVSVRHVLVDIALNNSDIDRASELMATIKEPPEGSDKFMWWLRRARILVLGNQTEVGAQALHDLLNRYKELKQEQIDKFLQVVFDLQTAGKQELAYGLFERILGYSKDEQVQREIYYWMADSRKSQKRYVEAAQLYLKSAMHPNPENMDPWAQTAHYQAAESLARAGLYEDATTLFKHLLSVTEDPTRRATLQRELQRLWAMQ